MSDLAEADFVPVTGYKLLKALPELDYYHYSDLIGLYICRSRRGCGIVAVLLETGHIYGEYELEPAYAVELPDGRVFTNQRDYKDADEWRCARGGAWERPQ